MRRHLCTAFACVFILTLTFTGVQVTHAATLIVGCNVAELIAAINTANNTATESKLSYVAPFVIVCLLGIVVFRFIPAFAAAITGGGALGQGDSAIVAGHEAMLRARREYAGRARILRHGFHGRRTSADVMRARARAIQRETEKNGHY